MLTKKEQLILNALEPKAQEQGLEIITVEITGASKAPTIRIYLDCEGGIGFEELSSAQTWVDAIVEEMDPFPGAYTLEVSSPGIDRPLRLLEHFERFSGEDARIVLSSPVDGRSKWTGVLCGTQDDCVCLEVEGQKVALPYDQIKRANVIAKIDFNS